ncbi:hypothetical protein [Amycolatopsis sp. NPDC001319]|uniref:hypothetical protein n=1 Tax=unclassified Amycolatopsis TaxID=2618356 RepID=UPI0036B9BBEF
MTAPTWYLVRYMPDLQRREPRNVGVVLRPEHGPWLTKFIGEREDGSINGQLLTKDIKTEVYKTWVDYYRRKASDEMWPDVERMQLARIRNFYIEDGGIYLGHITSMRALLEDLYAELVEAPAVPIAIARPERITARVDRILLRAGIRPQRNIEVEARFGDGTDLVPFRYSFENGQVHLMDVLSSRKPQDAAHDARELRARVQGVRDAGSIKSFIAFYDRTIFPEADLEHILRPIEGLSRTVDVQREEAAIRDMRELVSHGGEGKQLPR